MFNAKDFTFHIGHSSAMKNRVKVWLLKLGFELVPIFFVIHI